MGDHKEKGEELNEEVTGEEDKQKAEQQALESSIGPTHQTAEDGDGGWGVLGDPC